MRTLWAFGCSHTAGSGLKNMSIDETKKWMIDNCGYDNYHDYINSPQIQKNESLSDNLARKWTPFGEEFNFELSYPGRIANKLGMDLKNLAVPGRGMDFCFQQIEKADINWDNDIVLLGLPPVYRYLSNDESAVQLALVPDIEIWNRWVLHERSVELLYLSLYEKLKRDYSRLTVLHLYDGSTFCDQVGEVFGDNQSKLNRLEDVYGKYARTPCGHLIKELHEDFANNLIDEFGWKHVNSR